jgi:uncharacterized protein (DUF849 family)
MMFLYLYVSSHKNRLASHVEGRGYSLDRRESHNITCAGRSSHDEVPDTRCPLHSEEFVDTVAKYRKEGASIVHIHCRRPDTGAHTLDLEIIGNVLTAMKQKTPDIIINPR